MNFLIAPLSWMLFLFGTGIGMHILWIGAAVLAVAWIFTFSRTCSTR